MGWRNRGRVLVVVVVVVGGLTVITGILGILPNIGATKTVEEERWVNRRLTKGEPSGEEILGSTTIQVADEREEPKDKNIKISVTLPSRRRNVNMSAVTEQEQEQSVRIDIYKQRKRRVSSTCREYELGKFVADTQAADSSDVYRNMYTNFPHPVEKSLMYQQNWHLLYCWIHKVASTSWSKVFYNLIGKDVPPIKLHEATEHFAPSRDSLSSILSTSLVFTVVRHPFERLVSAYRDKFELGKRYAYVYTKYAAKMGGNFSSRPTFVQFVDYLLKEPVSQYNDHWVPYWLHCHVCDMEYDIIGKMETLQEDMNFIARASGLATTNISLPWANKRSGGEKDTLDYFRKLDLDRLERLYHIYRLDFLMFGYSPQAYFRLFDQP